ncbi:hypothetical protein HDU76_006448 [Blyttiomyces sp. JEL0837]|nr:hypothetical protein HDU76_006448 [Blyttiomyces sp. JEL0837]
MEAEWDVNPKVQEITMRPTLEWERECMRNLHLNDASGTSMGNDDWESDVKGADDRGVVKLIERMVESESGGVEIEDEWERIIEGIDSTAAGLIERAVTSEGTDVEMEDWEFDAFKACQLILFGSCGGGALGTCRSEGHRNSKPGTANGSEIWAFGSRSAAGSRCPGVDPAAKQNGALRGASRFGHLQVVKVLLATHRVDPAALNNEAIILASGSGHADVVELLLRTPGVNPTAQNNEAIRQATLTGYSDVVRLLEGAGCVYTP